MEKVSLPIGRHAKWCDGFTSRVHKGGISFQSQLEGSVMDVDYAKQMRTQTRTAQLKGHFHVIMLQVEVTFQDKNKTCLIPTVG
jgi:hypothetical protein